jgi:hypothetical protein
MGKVGALNGMNMDGTSFEDYDIDSIKDMLEKLGYNREGEEYLYNGMTGKKIKHMIFIGPTYYQRLKHMVEDKIHCLTPDHLVLTNVGWKRIPTITRSDMIAIQGIDSLVYVSPSNVIGYPMADRQIISLYYPTGEIMQRITNEHRLYVSLPIDTERNEWGKYQAIPFHNLLNSQYMEGNVLHVRMLSGDNKIIHGPFTFKQDIETTTVHCLTVEGGLFLTRHISNDISTPLTPESGENNSLINAGVWTGNSRARGPTTILTHQAPEGRSRDGGLRLGKFMPMYELKFMQVCTQQATSSNCGKILI